MRPRLESLLVVALCARAARSADLLVLGADPTRDVTAFRALRTVVRGGVVHDASTLSVGR